MAQNGPIAASADPAVAPLGPMRPPTADLPPLHHRAFPWGFFWGDHDSHWGDLDDFLDCLMDFMMVFWKGFVFGDSMGFHVDFIGISWGFK